MANNLTLKDLRPARYNPRSISEKRLTDLGKSFEQFGDLSGVVFNRRTRTLVSGHQRLKANAGKKITIKTEPTSDNHGTVEIGYILVQDKNSKFRIPFRVVDWSDSKTEKAANIAANAHGGDWDKDKLSVLLAELQRGKFDVELTGLDALTIKSLRLPEDDGQLSKNSGANRNSFKDLNESVVTTDHKCPKCGYRW